MKNSYPGKSYSIMTVINLSLFTIVALTLVTIFSTIWVTDLSDQDAQSINLSGSIRMQTYRVGLDLQMQNIPQASSHIKQLDKTWNHTLFTRLQTQIDDTEILESKAVYTAFAEAYRYWFILLRPELIKRINNPQIELPSRLIEEQTRLTDILVNEFQFSAEKKIRSLRLFQLLAFFIMITASSAIFYLLKNRIEKPLTQLTRFAHRIGGGDYGKQISAPEPDEFGLMATVMNHMSRSIDSNHLQLENRVKERTEELQNNNVSLGFLFDLARSTLDSHQKSVDYTQLFNEMANKLQLSKIKLCLFTQEGERPYLQLIQEDEVSKDCNGKSCEQCLGDAPFVRKQGALINITFPIVHDKKNYGVINASTHNDSPLPQWKEKLLASIADQIAIALSMSEQEAQSRRMAMISERTVIARELHDSLAQALSYLQIQASRLQKTYDKERFDLQPPIINELREGLSTAYRQLRELLTTFRLKVDKDGLKAALTHTVEQLHDRTNMIIKLNCDVADLPLTPTEEIHLLQIAREALQNCVHHSQGTEASITLTHCESNGIRLTVDDNGIGVPDSPEKLNHYGLAIMAERSKHLLGKLEIKARKEGGTRVEFSFIPAFALEQ